MIDLSAVRADVDLAEVQRLAEVCTQYQCACAFVMPCYMPHLKQWLTDTPGVGLGGVVGFPSGAQSTALKVAETHSHVELGATEIDMVINVGMLKSRKRRLRCQGYSSCSRCCRQNPGKGDPRSPPPFG